MKVKIEGIELELRKGDITSQPDIDAIVNAANARLAPGGGVAGAIHRKAGPQLYEECKKLAPIKTGEAVITKGYNLPNPYVIHTLGPVYNSDPDPAGNLSLCYRNCLNLADKNRLKSIAFPAISTGIFGYPLEEAAKISLKAVVEEIPILKNIKKICFVLYDDASFRIFREALENVTKKVEP